MFRIYLINVAIIILKVVDNFKGYYVVKNTDFFAENLNGGVVNRILDPMIQLYVGDRKILVNVKL